MIEENVRIRSFEVLQSGERLDQWLQKKIPRLSRTKIKGLIALGRIEIIPKRGKLKPSRRLKRGDRVIVREYLAPEKLQYREVKILEVHEEYVVLDKPAGMLVHPNAREYQNTLTAYVQAMGWKEANVVHRLDRETSGVIIMARGKGSQRKWAEHFAKHRIQKTYLAVVWDPKRKHLPGMSGENHMSLGYDVQSLLPHLKIGPGSWKAETHWRCISRRGPWALLKVGIQHGRQHQIRVHLAYAGTPIAGDKLYLKGDLFFIDYLEGRADLSELCIPHHALHAWSLHLEGQKWQTSLPRRFEALMGPMEKWPW